MTIIEILSIFDTLTSGKYYPPSNARKELINSYKDGVVSLSQEDYNQFKILIMKAIPDLVVRKNKKKIAYSLLSNLIEYSCPNQNNIDVYLEYEKVIMELANNAKIGYFDHIITLAQTKLKLNGNISNIEDFVIERYLCKTRIDTISFNYLMDFTRCVKNTNMKKFFRYLMNSKPFRNDKILIKAFVTQNKELEQYASLL